jgi:hypothetical protein
MKQQLFSLSCTFWGQPKKIIIWLKSPCKSFTFSSSLWTCLWKSYLFHFSNIKNPTCGMEFLCWSLLCSIFRTETFGSHSNSICFSMDFLAWYLVEFCSVDIDYNNFGLKGLKRSMIMANIPCTLLMILIQIFRDFFRTRYWQA